MAHATGIRPVSTSRPRLKPTVAGERLYPTAKAPGVYGVSSNTLWSARMYQPIFRLVLFWLTHAVSCSSTPPSWPARRTAVYYTVYGQPCRATHEAVGQLA